MNRPGILWVRHRTCGTRLAVATAVLMVGLLAGHGIAGQPSPKDIPGLYLWYQADSIAGVADNQTVTRWNDDGPNSIPLDRHLGSPTLVANAVGQMPAVRLREGRSDGLQTSTAVSALAGNPGFTIFLAAQVARSELVHVQALGWGDGGARAGAGMFIEFQSGRVDLGTGFSADANTPDECYAELFGKPAIIMCAKSAGLLSRTAQITLNGVGCLVSGTAIVPNVHEGCFIVGADSKVQSVSPAMDVAEIIVFNRMLSRQEQNQVGYYLEQKYGWETHFVDPDDFVLVPLEVRAEPRELEAWADFAGPSQQLQGTSVSLAAKQKVVLHDETGARVFSFDHWEGAVSQHRSADTTVRMDRAMTVTAVYREEKIEIYVATNGRDDWSGTLPKPSADGTDGPFATLARARDAVRQRKAASGGRLPAPVQILVRGGTYRLDEPLLLGAEDSGTWDGRVSYTAYPGEEAILSGGRKVTGWKPYKEKILQASLEGAENGKWRFRQLFYNRKAQIRARTPNSDPVNPLQGGWATMEGPAEPGSQTAFKYKPGTFANRWAKPSQGEVNVYIGADWANNIIPIQSLDDQNRVITLAHSTTRFAKPWLPFDYPTPFNPNQRFRVENLLEELDQPGEWYLDWQEGKLYFWPPDDSWPGAEIVVPKLPGLMSLRDASYIVISGLSFAETTGGDNFHHEGTIGTGAMFPMPGWNYCGDALHLKGAEHCRIEDNRFYNLGGNAIYLEGHNARNLIRGNEISHTGACGVALAGGEEHYPVFNRIEANHIHHTGQMNMYSAGVFAALSEGNVIGHNSIHHVPHHAINLGNSGRSRNLVEYNEIRHTCLETHDTGAINCWMEEGDRTWARQGHIIRHNLIVDSRERGIYLDNYTSNCHVYGNVIIRAATVGIVCHGGKNNVLENNVIVGSAQAIAYYDGIDGLMPHMAMFSSGMRFCRNIVADAGQVLFLSHKRPDHVVAQSDYNVFFNAGDTPSYLEHWRQAGQEIHSLVADPLFLDPQQDDFRLQADSPALQLGFQPIDFTQFGPPNRAPR